VMFHLVSVVTVTPSGSAPLTPPGLVPGLKWLFLAFLVESSKKRQIETSCLQQLQTSHK